MISKKKIFFSIPIVILFALANPVEASDDLGYFYNDQIQNKLAKSYQLTFDKKSLAFPLSDYTVVEATLVEKPGYSSEIENPFYCEETVKKIPLCDLTVALSSHHSLQKAGRLFLDKDKVQEKLKSVAKEVDKTPENGRLKIGEDGRAAVYTESQDGAKLNVEKSYQNIKAAVASETTDEKISLAVEIIKPDVATKNVDEYGIKELVAQGQSNFRGSTTNRIHNIKTALNRFEGYLLKPGEEFSFTTILGEVDGDHGYKEELVIKKNETIPEFGGGVCQVSTTMFRAALNAGLKITERHNHAYPVQYYAPQGTDATIYVPSPDLKFINNTPAYILIQSKIEGTILTINFYGTSDGRQVELDGPYVVEKTAEGKLRTTLTQIVKDSGGNITQQATFKSLYDNPANYHHDDVIREKPADWSKKQWRDYKIQHGI